MDDHGEEEDLNAPKVDAVEELPDAGLMPPGRALEPEDDAGAMATTNAAIVATPKT